MLKFKYKWQNGPFQDTLSAPGPPYNDQSLIKSFVAKEFGGQKNKNGTSNQVSLIKSFVAK